MSERRSKKNISCLSKQHTARVLLNYDYIGIVKYRYRIKAWVVEASRFQNKNLIQVFFSKKFER